MIAKNTFVYVLECPPVFYGENCGYTCSNNCYMDNICNRSTGQCELGCKAGWTGILCNQGKVFICINEKMLMKIQCSNE